MTATPVVDSICDREAYAGLPAGRPLRIAMLSLHSSPLGDLGAEDTGGMSVYISELSKRLGKMGHRIDIYTCAHGGMEGTELSLSEGVRLIRLDIPSAGHMTKNRLLGSLNEAFLSLEALTTRSRRCYDLIHSHYWMSGSVGLLAQKRWNLPHLITFHTTGMAKRLACGSEREPMIRLKTERRLGYLSDRVIATTEGERDLLERYYGIERSRVGVVPCGVNLDRFKPFPKYPARKELGLQDVRSLVLYVGRFAPVKGLERLVAAAAHLRGRQGLTLLIIGGDGQAGSTSGLRRLIKKTSLDNLVRLHGRVEHDLLPLYYSSADLTVVPSYYESFGLVALESLACGTPVVSTRVGVMDSVVREGKTGLIVDEPNPATLAAAIVRLLSDSSLGTMSRSETRASVAGYDWSRIALEVVREYHRVLSPLSVGR